jgi:hypothetical protein
MRSCDTDNVEDEEPVTSAHVEVEETRKSYTSSARKFGLIRKTKLLH